MEAQKISLKLQHENNISLLMGNFEKIPEFSTSSEIMILISSSNEDFNLEKNYFLQHHYYDLQRQFISKYQRDLLLIDFKWGINTENIDNNANICLDEIKKYSSFANLSSFMVFLIGQSFGLTSLKPSIAEQDFKIIKNELKLTSSDSIVKFFESFYELDENFLTKKEYKLKNASKIISNLKIDRQKYIEIQSKLLDAIRKCVLSCLKKGKFNDKQTKPYLYSAGLKANTLEIYEGIINNNYSNIQSLAIFRNIRNVDKINKINKFIESDESKITLLQSLKKEVEHKIEKNKIDLVIDLNLLENFEHSKEPTKNTIDYLEKYSEILKKSINELISLNFKNNQIKLNEEVIQHARLCNQLNLNIYPRKHLIKTVNDYLEDIQNNKPFLLLGKSETGKTSLMACLAKNIKERNQNSIVIIRFMATSSKSATIRLVLKSIIEQLDFIIGKTENSYECKNDSLQYLKEEMKKKLTKTTEKSSNRKIIILIDSVDESFTEFNYYVDCIIYELPKNVKIIYSYNYEHNFDKIKRRINNNYLEIFKIETSEVKIMLQSLLEINNRCISIKQWESIDSLLEKSSTNETYPLYAKLLFDICSKWNSSYEIPEDINTCISSVSTIKYIFKSLEVKYGQILFSRCIFYLTIFENKGIPENELEDILSIDDDVLNEIFKENHPSVRRFPIGLWLMIKNELKDYIIKKEIDGVSVISWFHKTFINAAKEYYEAIFTQSELKDKLLINIVDYFTEKWNEIRSDGQNGEMKEFVIENENDKKIINYFKQIKKDLTTVYLSYRNTKSQKIKTEKSKMTISINKRKLNEFLNIIVMLENKEKKIQILKEHIYYNYDFMQSKAILGELSFALEMHDTILELNDVELIEISRIYINQLKAIENEPRKLAMKVLSRLKVRSANVKKFSNAASAFYLLNSYIKRVLNFKDLFVPEINTEIEYYYLMNNTNFGFIITKPHKNSYELAHTSLQVINLKKRRYLKKLDLLNGDLMAVKIMIYDDNESINNFNLTTKLNGEIFFSLKTNNKTLYSINFNDERLYILQNFEKEIFNIFILDNNILAVFLKNKIMILNIENREIVKIEQVINENDDIYFIKSTIPEDRVFSVEYLPLVNLIKIIVILKAEMKIYKFNKITKKLDLFCKMKIPSDWITYNLRQPGLLIIDADYMIGSNNIQLKKSENKTFIRFILENQKSVFQVIEIKANYQYTVVDHIDETKFQDNDEDDENEESNHLQVIAYHGNTLIFRLIKTHLNIIFWYDLESKEYNEIPDHDSYTYHYHNHETDTFVLISFDELLIYKMKNSNLTKEGSMSFNDQKFIKSIQVKDDKLIGILDNSLKSIDYLSICDQETQKPEVKINKILFKIDKSLALINIKIDEKKYKYAIIDIITMKIHNSVITSDYIGCNNPYFLTFNDAEENGEIDGKNYLKIYAIQNMKGKIKLLNIRKILISNGITNDEFLKPWRFHEKEIDSSKFLVELYNKMNDQTEVIFIEENQRNGFNVKKSIIDYKDLELDRTIMPINSAITSLNNYLVLWEFDNKVIYYKNIFNNSVILKTILNNYIWDVLPISSTDNLIVKIGDSSERSSIYAIYLDKFELIAKIVYKESGLKLIDSLVIKNGFLILRLENSTHFYDLNEMKIDLDFKPIVLNKRCWDCCISNNKQKLYFLDFDKELSIYSLNNKVEQLTSLQLDEHLLDLHLIENKIVGINTVYRNLQIFELTQQF